MEIYLKESRVLDNTILEFNNEYINNNSNNNNSNDNIEDEMNIYDLENMNYNSFKFIVIDLGNVEYTNDKVQDEIMMRNYRPPENIISSFYDCKADMWSLGCLIYEFITNNYLFEVSRRRNSIYRDRSHLHKMYEYLGKMPKELALKSDFKKDLFDHKGNILKKKKCEYTNLEELLEQESTYEIIEIKELSDFLKKILVYNPEKRITSKQCYESLWLKI